VRGNPYLNRAQAWSATAAYIWFTLLLYPGSHRTHFCVFASVVDIVLAWAGLSFYTDWSGLTSLIRSEQEQITLIPLPPDLVHSRTRGLGNRSFFPFSMEIFFTLFFLIILFGLVLLCFHNVFLVSIPHIPFLSFLSCFFFISPSPSLSFYYFINNTFPLINFYLFSLTYIVLVSFFSVVYIVDICNCLVLCLYIWFLLVQSIFSLSFFFYECHVIFNYFKTQKLHILSYNHPFIMVGLSRGYGYTCLYKTTDGGNAWVLLVNSYMHLALSTCQTFM
jgi:hypothetical protein